MTNFLIIALIIVSVLLGATAFFLFIHVQLVKRMEKHNFLLEKQNDSLKEALKQIANQKYSQPPSNAGRKSD